MIMHFFEEMHHAQELKEDWDHLMSLQCKTDSETTSEAAARRSQTIESSIENGSDDNEEDSDYNPDKDGTTKFAYASKLKQQNECIHHLKEIYHLKKNVLIYNEKLIY